MRSSVESIVPASASAGFGRPGDAARLRRMPLCCLLCNRTQHRTVFTEFGLDVLQCEGCGHVFSSFPADPHYAGFWGNEVAPGEHHYWSKARARMHRDFFGRFIVGRSGRLLDMGSGLGFFLKALTSHPDWEVHGCEISPAAVRYAREQLGLQNVLCSPPQNVNLAKASFDIITMWDVIDHVSRPDPLLSRCHELLKERGMLFLRTPNVAVQLPRARLVQAVCGLRPGRKYLQPADHPHHYSTHSIQRLLHRNGFADVAFIHLHPVETGTGWKGAIVNAAKRMSYQILRSLSVGSGGSLNFDNLFIVARKGAAVPSA